MNGVHEQSYLGTLMSYAACIGDFLEDPECLEGRNGKNSAVANFAGGASMRMVLTLLSVMFATMQGTLPYLS